MSYIHDALKRSQAQRQQVKSGPEASLSLGAGAPGKKSRAGMYLLAALFLLLGLAAAAYYSGRLPVVAAPELGQAMNKPATAAPEADTGQPLHKPQQARGVSVNTPYADLPYLWELPDSMKTVLGTLSVNIHVYADNPGQRFLYLNNREYRAGEQTPAGVRVVRIEPQGAVLSYADQVFRLPRPR